MQSPSSPSAPQSPWIQTHSGKKFPLVNPHPSCILIDDIAHALSMQCRFAGQCDRFYSVAEHSVHVSRQVEREHQLAGLLHDATEAYLHDLSRPLKQLLPGYKVLEERLWFVISAKYGLDYELPACVKEADATMVFVERRKLFSNPVEAEDWGHGLVEPDVLPDVGLIGWPQGHAKRMFYDRFFELTQGKAAA